MKSKLFEESKDIPPIHVHEKGKKPKTHEPTLKNHLNDGGHDGTMDDKERHGLKAHELPTDVMD
jgi:hypothetical protein